MRMTFRGLPGLLLGVVLAGEASAELTITEFTIEDGKVRLVFDDPDQSFNRFKLQDAPGLPPSSWTELPDSVVIQIDARRFLFVVPMESTNRRFFSVVGSFLTTALDADGDGLPAALEADLGTNVTLFDTDHDGFSDGVEDNFGSNPRDPPQFSRDEFGAAGAVCGSHVQWDGGHGLVSGKGGL